MPKVILNLFKMAFFLHLPPGPPGQHYILGRLFNIRHDATIIRPESVNPEKNAITAINVNSVRI